MSLLSSLPAYTDPDAVFSDLGRMNTNRLPTDPEADNDFDYITTDASQNGPYMSPLPPAVFDNSPP